MLSKKQFNGSVARLRNIATAEDLIQMLTHQLNKADADKHADLIAQLNEIAPTLQDTQLLDRRRAENYLANTLYGRNHSQVVHLFGHTPDDYTFGVKLSLMGELIVAISDHVGSRDYSHYKNDPYYKAHRRVGFELLDKLRMTNPEDFHAALYGFEYHHERFDQAYNTRSLAYIAFEGTELVIEVDTIELGDNDEEREVDDVFDYIVKRVTLNGKPIDDLPFSYFGVQEDDASGWDGVCSVYEIIAEKLALLKHPDFFCGKYTASTVEDHEWLITTPPRDTAKHLLIDLVLGSVHIAVNGDFEGHDSYPADVVEKVKSLRVYLNYQCRVEAKGFHYEGLYPAFDQSGQLIFSSPDNGRSVTVECSYYYSQEYQEIRLRDLKVSCDGTVLYEGEAYKNNPNAPWSGVTKYMGLCVGFAKRLLRDGSQ